MGRILFGGTAALLILHLPEPQVHRLPAQARVRAAHPRGRTAGHLQKAGTPTMGGVLIFIAVSASFLILTDWEWRSIGVFGRRSRAPSSVSPMTTRSSSSGARSACALAPSSA